MRAPLRLSLLCVLALLLASCVGRGGRVTHQGAVIEDPFAQEAVRSLLTAELAASAALNVITAGVEDGTIPVAIGIQADQAAATFAQGLQDAKTALVAYLAGAETQAGVQATLVPIRALLRAILALSEVKKP